MLKNIILSFSLIFLIGCKNKSPKGTNTACYHQEYNHYRDFSEFTQDLKDLKACYPNNFTVKTIGTTYEKRDIFVVHIISNTQFNKKTILLIGGTHAREKISYECAFGIMEKFISEQNESVLNFLQNYDVWVVPILNPDGLEYALNVDKNWRKNRQKNDDGSYGVDINRNFDFMWDKNLNSSTNPSSLTYKGKYPFSEAESSALRDLCETLQPDFVFSYHSFGKEINYPWGYTTFSPPNLSELLRVSNLIANGIKKYDNQIYKVTQASKLYKTSGDFIDWVYFTFSSLAATIELPPSTKSEGGFNLPAKDIKKVIEENFSGLLTLKHKSKR